MGELMDLIMDLIEEGNSPFAILLMLSIILPVHLFLNWVAPDWGKLPDYQRIAELERELGLATAEEGGDAGTIPTP